MQIHLGKLHLAVYRASKISSYSIEKGRMPKDWHIRFFPLKRLAACELTSAGFRYFLTIPVHRPRRPSTIANTESLQVSVIHQHPGAYTPSTPSLCKWFAGAVCDRAVRLVRIGLQLPGLTQ